MKVGVARERIDGERRVAATPETVGQLEALGLDVVIESGAGVAAGNADAAYREAGAVVVPGLELGDLDVLLHVRPLSPDQVSHLNRGAVTIGFASPASELPTVSALADAGITSFALELVPRISRAQSMDALSSQALVAGYRCVLEAADALPPVLPALHDRRRHRSRRPGCWSSAPASPGCRRSAPPNGSAPGSRRTTSAPASADEVASMGGTFINLDLETLPRAPAATPASSARTAPPGSASCSPRTSRRPTSLITTAAIPGRRGPAARHPARWWQAMRPGSVVVDLAAESGGNVEGVRAGRGRPVPIGDGASDAGGAEGCRVRDGPDASRLYAKNVANLLALMTGDGTWPRTSTTRSSPAPA